MRRLNPYGGTMSTESGASPSFVDYNYPVEKLEEAVRHLAYSTGPRKAALETVRLTIPYFMDVNAEADARLPTEIRDKLQQLRELLGGSLEVWDVHTAIALMCELAFTVCRKQAALLEREGMPGT